MRTQKSYGTMCLKLQNGAHLGAKKVNHSLRKWGCLLEYGIFEKVWHWHWTSCLNMAKAKGSKQPLGTWAGLESDSRQSSFNTKETSRRWLPVNTGRSSTSLYRQKNDIKTQRLQRNQYIFTRWKYHIHKGSSTLVELNQAKMNIEARLTQMRNGAHVFEEWRSLKYWHKLLQEVVFSHFFISSH